MSLPNDPRFLTILRLVSEANLGGEHPIGLFASFDRIVEEMGDEDIVEQIIDALYDLGYIRNINKKYEEKYDRELGYKAYQITELGKTFLQSKGHISNFVILNHSSSSDSAIRERLNKLIDESDSVLKTHTPNPPNVIGFATLDSGAFQKWKTSSENIIKAIAGKSSGYLDNFIKETKRGGHKNCVNAGKGILLALKEDLESGILTTQIPLPISNAAYEISEATITSNVVSIRLNDAVFGHIKKYLDANDYFHAVEESYKVVREKLREITGKEKATDIFNMNAENNKYHNDIFGKTAERDSPEEDFFRGVGYLNLAIQFLRNEKSHSLATTLDKNLALHYIALASLAYDLISRGVK